MIEIKYVDSGGKEYDLIGDKMRVTNGMLHSYTWDVESVASQYGEKVKRFTKKPIEYSVTLTFRGLLEERKKLMNELTDSFERDIAEQKEGRIYFGDYYINCYIKSSESGVSETWNNWSTKSINIYCPYPFWCRDKTYNYFLSQKQIDLNANKPTIDDVIDTSTVSSVDYPYNYKYDYYSTYKQSIVNRIYDYKYDYYSNNTVNKLDNDHYTSSGFKMIIYGPCTRPDISIGDNVYRLNATLSDGEYIVIDSRERTITKYAINGVIENLFRFRDLENDVFKKIASGVNVVKWNAQYSFDVILYQERSEPLWNTL